MSQRSLRGSGLGSTSYEDDRNVEFAARQEVVYDCPEGHVMSKVFSVDAEVPAEWNCETFRCTGVALRRGFERPEGKYVKPPRRHWDMLMERRTMTDLEDLFAERLALLRAGELVGGEHLARTVAPQRRSRSVRKSA